MIDNEFLIDNESQLIKASALRDGGTQVLYLMMGSRSYGLKLLNGLQYKKTDEYGKVSIGSADEEMKVFSVEKIKGLKAFLLRHKDKMPEAYFNAWINELKTH